MSLFPSPEPPPEYFCKMLGHDLMRWVLPSETMPRVEHASGKYIQIGMCRRCWLPLLKPASTGVSND